MRSLSLTTMAVSAALLGCQSGDLDPPFLEIDRPERGTVSSGTDVVLEVDGRATDDGDGLDHVEVNGVPAAVDATGRFTTRVTPTPGIYRVHVVAVDRAGNRASQTRAILSGPLAPLDRPVEEAFALSLSADTFATIGVAAADAITAADLGEQVAPLNPILEAGTTCLSARVDVAEIEKSAVHLALVPGPDRLALTAQVDDLDVSTLVRFEAACVDGDADARARADRLRVSADLVLDLDGPALAVALENVTAQLDGFSLQVSAIPDAVLDLFADQLGDLISGILVDQIEAEVAPLVQDALAGLGRGQPVDVFGTPLVLQASPRALTIDERGAVVVLDAAVSAPGAGPEIGYLANPQELPALDRGDGFALALADQAANQALTAVWAAGGLDFTIEPDGLQGPVHITALLPPVVQSGEAGLSIALGDLRVVVETPGEGDASFPSTVVTVNLAASLAITAAEDDTLAVQVGDPQLFIDFEEEEDPDGQLASGGEAGRLRARDGDEAVDLIAQLTGRVAEVAGAIVVHVPVPSVAGLRLADLAVAAGPEAPGYLVASGRLVPSGPRSAPDRVALPRE